MNVVQIARGDKGGKERNGHLSSWSHSIFSMSESYTELTFTLKKVKTPPLLPGSFSISSFFQVYSQVLKSSAEFVFCNWQDCHWGSSVTCHSELASMFNFSYREEPNVIWIVTASLVFLFSVLFIFLRNHSSLVWSTGKLPKIIPRTITMNKWNL